MTKLQEHGVELVIRNDSADLPIVTRALEQIARAAAVPCGVKTQLQVALDEVLSNVIKYAWPQRGAHAIQVRISALNGMLQVSVTDDGKPFDPRFHPPPAPSPPGQRPRPGGVGVAMVRKLVDRLEYARRDGRNYLLLIKNYEPHEPSGDMSVP
jgi:anti-sigma regulatory factor (Ser/Thr protein kinase)